MLLLALLEAKIYAVRKDDLKMVVARVWSGFGTIRQLGHFASSQTEKLNKGAKPSPDQRAVVPPRPGSSYLSLILLSLACFVMSG